MNISPRALFGLFSLMLFLFSCHADPIPLAESRQLLTEEEGKIDKLTRMDLAIAQEFEMTVDPALGRVPRERLLAAKYDLQRGGSGVQRSAIPGISWEERGPNNVSGRTRDILIDASDPTGNTIYAGSVGGGLWKCENALSNNPTWTTVNDFFENLAVCAIAQDPNNSDVMYFGTGEGFFNGDAIEGLGIWKTTDGGQNWNYLNSTGNSTFDYTQKLVVNSAGTVFAATRHGGIQASTDGGVNWTKVLGSGETAATNRAADLELAADGDLYVGMGLFSSDGIYKSSDNGNSWTKLTNGLPSDGYERIELACAPSNANVVYALLQDADDRSCQGIYVTTNGGTSWTAKNSPSAFGMSSFARNQAWYDLIAAVDPNDQNRIFIGGVDLLVSDDGGNSWEQISQWYGGNGMQYVHADQHSIRFLPGNSDLVYFGNDGGVFISTNASAPEPDIDFISNGYNVTQFYGCAIHPGENVDYFLAGAQDNGTQQFIDPGLNNTFEVTGGDGGFCHIDQDNPQIQITTYVYNQYRVSTDGGNTFSFRNFNTNGRFINPFAYDDPANIIYGANSNGTYLRWNDPATAGDDDDIVSVSGFDGGRVSHVAPSPNVANRVYFGLGSGRLVRVDNAHTGFSKTGAVLYDGLGFLSCIAIEEGDEDHMLITYSSYGVISVFETTDGGATWLNVEGNLPDIPIRWVVFSPNSADEALVATELGVWSTSNLEGVNTVWAASNTGLANVRTDMLKTRSSDNLVIAATHGRGLFSTGRFSDLFVGFDEATIQVEEFVNTGDEGDCELNFQEIEIPVSVNRFPTSAVENVTVYFNVVDTSTAVADNDFILLTDSLQFQVSDTEKVKYVRVKVLDDAIEESTMEKLILEMTTDSDVETTRTVHTLEILDNDEIPDGGAIDFTGQLGLGTEDIQITTPFRGYWHDAKAQYLYLASELTAMGFVAGPITELAFDVTDLGSSIDYNGFTISLKGSDITEFTPGNFETGFTEVYSGTYDPIEGWNNFVFDTPFEWNGTDNLVLQTCFDNSAYTFDDRVSGTFTDFTASVVRYLDGSDGCSLSSWNNSASSRPNIRMRQFRSLEIADQLASKNSFIVENDTAHFYDDEGALILSIINLAGGDLGCVDVQIDQYGTGQVFPGWLNDAAHSQKTFLITADDDAPYELTLYLSQEELAVWDDPTILSILKTPGPIAGHTGNNFEVLEAVNVAVEPFGTAGDYTYTATFQSFSGFTITDAEPQSPLPLELLRLDAQARDGANLIEWRTTNEVDVDYLELQRSLDGTNFRSINTITARNNAPEVNTYQYLDQDLRRSRTSYYYRLKVVDLDASFVYSDIKSLTIGTDAGQSKIFPNPFGNSISVVPAGSQRIQTVVISDATGRTVSTTTWDGAPIDLAPLANGIYWARLTYENGQTEVQRIVKTR